MTPKLLEEKKRNVTLIAGFNCIDGYIICSDSQETVGDMRAPAEKLSIWTEGNFEVALAGSGNNGELIDAFEERFRDELSQNQGVSSLKTLKDLFHTEFEDFQKTEAASHSASERRMRFVVGARLLATGERALWASKATRLKVVDKYTLVGFWDERYKFAVEGYLKPNPTPTIAQGIFLGLYVMWLGEQTSNYIKSPVHVAIIKNGQIIRERQDKIDAMFQRVKLFSAQFDKLFLACPDTGLQNNDFAARLRSFVETIVTLRQEYVQEWVEQAIQIGLDKIVESYNLAPTGMTMILDQQSAEHQRIQQALIDAWRQNEDGKQSKERLLSNLGIILRNRRKLLLKYENPEGLPVEELSESEKTDDAKAFTELDAAARMGAFKVSQEVVNLIGRAVWHIATNLLFGEHIELQLQCIAAQQAMSFVERTMPLDSQTSGDQP